MDGASSEPSPVAAWPPQPAASPGAPPSPAPSGTPFSRHAFACTTGSSCPYDGPALAAHKAMKRIVKEAGLSGAVRVNQAGCLDQCGHGPMVVVYPEGTWYSHVTEADAARIAAEHLVGGRVVEDLLYRSPKAGANKVPKRPGPAGPDNPVGPPSPAWALCTRCPAEHRGPT